MNNALLKIPALLIIFSCLTVVLPGCKKNGSSPAPSATTTITSLSVTEGPFDTNITINGTGFNTNALNNTVLFNGKPAVVTAAAETHLAVKVPVGAGTGPVTVSVSGATAATGPIFTYLYTTTVSTLALADGRPAEFGTEDNWGIAVDASGNVFSVCIDRKIRELSASGILTVFAGNGVHSQVNGKGTAASFSFASGMQKDAAGNMFVADNSQIRQISTNADVTTFAKKTDAGFIDVAIDKDGNKYATDGVHNLIIKISATGVVSTFAGSGAKSSTDGKGLAASFDFPFGITVDAANNIYVTDSGSNRIRKITTDGTVTTIAGSGAAGATDGKGSAASFNNPAGIVADGKGNLFVADFANLKIRKIAADGTVSTYAGTGGEGSDGGLASNATFNAPQGITIDVNGSIYVTDHKYVRKINSK